MPQPWIHIASRRLAALCTAVMVVLPVGSILYWSMSSAEALSSQWAGAPDGIAHLGWTERLVGLLLTAIAVIPLSLCLLWLRRLLRLYHAGMIFDRMNVIAIGKIGKWLAWFGVAQFLNATSIPLALTFGNPVGRRLLVITTGSAGAFEAIVLGGVMLILARVMDEARRIADEQAHTI